MSIVFKRRFLVAVMVMMVGAMPPLSAWALKGSKAPSGSTSSSASQALTELSVSPQAQTWAQKLRPHLTPLGEMWVKQEALLTTKALLEPDQVLSEASRDSSGLIQDPGHGVSRQEALVLLVLVDSLAVSTEDMKGGAVGATGEAPAPSGRFGRSPMDVGLLKALRNRVLREATGGGARSSAIIGGAEGEIAKPRSEVPQAAIEAHRQRIIAEVNRLASRFSN